MSRYQGPLRDGPLAVELHNTLYVAAGELIDGLAHAASSDAWMAGLDPRLPPGGTGAGPKAVELIELRQAVREALQAVIEGARPSRVSIDTINLSCARAPRFRAARWSPHAPLVSDWDFGPARRADVVLSAFAASAIELLTGPDAANLRVCGAPGCVLMFLRDHPRREWCSGPCGNRARQARHYRRTHRGT